MSDKPINEPVEPIDNETDDKKIAPIGCSVQSTKRKTERYERVRFRGKIHEEEQVVFNDPDEFIKFMVDNEDIKLQTTTRLNQKYKIAGYYIGRRKNEITIMRNAHENVAMCNPKQKLFDLERETLKRYS